MDVNVSVRPGLKISAFYLFFIISNIQTGTGIMGAPRYAFMEAKQDAWISVIIAGIAMHLATFVMFLLLKKYDSADIFGIQVDLFGKWIGRLLGTVIVVYFFAGLLSVMIKYIQVVQVFIFPLISPWILAIFLLFLVTYCVSGGIRVAVGVCFTFFFLGLWLLFLLYKPISIMDFGHFKPVLEATPKELLAGAKAITYSCLGFEALLVIYPFIDNKKKAQLPAQLGIAMTTLLIFIVTFVSIGVFGGDSLEHALWPVLILYKFITYQVLARVDIIVVAGWMLVILPVMIMLTWIITYGMKRLYKVKQRTTLYITVILLFIGAGTIKEEFMIQRIINSVETVGLYLAFVYPLVLYPIVLIKKKFSSLKEGK